MMNVDERELEREDCYGNDIWFDFQQISVRKRTLQLHSKRDKISANVQEF